MGCLLAPFRALGFLVILVAVGAGWLYRDRVLETVMQLAGRRAPASAGVARPGTRALAAARARVDSVTRNRADSVVLSPAEMASLIGDGLAPEVRSQLDSLTVRLLDGQIEVGGRLAGDRIPKNLLGPLALAVTDRTPVRAVGPVDVVGPGRGTWQIVRLDLGGVPVPGDALGRLLDRVFGEQAGRALPIAIPPGVREIRIRPTGAVLFGARRS
jgi:hypothetical protein